MKARSNSTDHLCAFYPTLGSMRAVTKIRRGPRLLALSTELPLVLEQWPFPDSVFSVLTAQLVPSPTPSPLISALSIFLSIIFLETGWDFAGNASWPGPVAPRGNSCHLALGNLLAFFSYVCTNMAGCTGAKRKFRHLPIL